MVAVAQPSLNVEFFYTFISFETGRKGYSIQVFQQNLLTNRPQKSQIQSRRIL
jgi:hypothetical protein